MNIEIGSYEAKTKLPELLRGVQAGNRYTITLRGEAVADLVPAARNRIADALMAVAEMQQLMLEAPTVSGSEIKALIDAGRA
jgi:prevent-host-death family protein